MKEKVIYVIRKIRNAAEITLVVHLFYTFLVTLLKIKFIFISPTKTWYSTFYGWDSWFLNSYFSIKRRSNYVVSPAFLGQPILEILIFVLPTVVIILRELYIRRDKLIKNYDSYKQKKNNKKIKRLEQQIEELKKGQ